AQFGRGVMGEVSKKLMDQFADNLNAMLDDQAVEAVAAPAETPAPAPASESAADAPAAASEPAADAAPAPETPTVRKIDGPAAETRDMAGWSGLTLLKRLCHDVAEVLMVLFVLRKCK